MSFQETLTEIRKSAPRPVTLILSTEDKLSETLVEELRKKILTEETAILFGSELEANRFTQSLFETGLFSTTRLFYIREFDEISWTDESKAGFLRWIQSSSQSDTVILTGAKKSKIPRNILNAIKEHGRLYELKALYERDVAVIIKKLAAESKIELDSGVVDRLIELCGTNLQDIYSQWEKLLLFLGSNKQLTLESLNETVEASSHFNVFQLIDSLMVGDFRRCIMISHMLLGANIHPLQPISVMVSHFAQLEVFALAVQNGENLSDLKTKLKVKDFVFRKIQKQISRYSLQKIQTGLKILQEMDVELKKRGAGAFQSRLIFEKGILRLIHVLKK